MAEQDPALPSLAVRLALDGARAFVTLRHPARLREVEGEIEQFRKGRTAGLRRMTLDFKPVSAESFYADSARAVSRQLTALPGPGFSAFPQDVRFKALIARGSFDGQELPAIEAALHEAGRVLAPGGGLVFEFTHDAGRPMPAPAGARLRCGSVGFHEIAQAVQRAGLGLRSLYVTFRLADDPAREIIPTRRVLPDAHGRIDLNRADAAALSGWNEIAQSDALHGRPVRINVSGVFVKQGKAND